MEHNTISVQVKEDLHSFLKREADDQGITLAGHVRRLLLLHQRAQLDAASSQEAK